MIPNVHAVPAGARGDPGQCCWRWHWEEVDLACTEPAIPGGRLCADHEIEKERRRPHGHTD